MKLVRFQSPELSISADWSPEKSRKIPRVFRPKNLKTYCRNMIGWFGEVGGTRENHTHRCALSFSYLDKRNVKKPPNAFFDFLTLVIRHRFFFFVPRNPKSDFLGKYKKTRAGKWSRSVLSKVNLEPYDAIWCQFGSQFSSPKTKNSS